MNCASIYDFTTVLEIMFINKEYKNSFIHVFNILFRLIKIISSKLLTYTNHASPSILVFHLHRHDNRPQIN